MVFKPFLFASKNANEVILSSPKVILRTQKIAKEFCKISKKTNVLDYLKNEVIPSK